MNEGLPNGYFWVNYPFNSVIKSLVFLNITVRWRQGNLNEK